MKLASVLALVLSTSLYSMDFDSKVARLVGPNAWMISGGDIARLRTSALPAVLPGIVYGFPADQNISQYMEINAEEGEGRLPLRVFQGLFNLSDFKADSEQPAISFYRNIPLVSTGGNGF